MDHCVEFGRGWKAFDICQIELWISLHPDFLIVAHLQAGVFENGFVGYGMPRVPLSTAMQCTTSMRSCAMCGVARRR